jgi:hypothetical protein
MKKHTIWSNINLNIADWRDGYREHLEMNDMDDADPNDEHAIYEWMNETNDMYFDDEYANLNKQLDGRIIVIADLGLWDGRKKGYKLLGTNLNEIFNINPRGFEYAEFYGDGHNIRATEHHHDGVNHYLYRVVREGRNIDNLLTAISNGEEITSSKLNYYTKSLYSEVADVYGWR